MQALIAPRNTRLYILSQFCYALVFTIPVWIVYYQGRISITQISLLVALQYFFQLIFELPTGALADLIGRRSTVFAGYIGWTVSILLIIGSSGFLPLVLAMLIAGLSEALLSGSLEALLYDSYKQDGNSAGFTRALATNGIVFQIGLAIATLTGGFFYQFWQPLPYVLSALACAIAAILSLKFIEPAIDSQKVTATIYLHQMKSGLKEAFKSKTVTTMSLFYVVVSTLTWTNNLYFFDFM
ncbi:MFS transporter, partial [Candidatus Woesebacteria bacterium]|nr:MFS transporter [Candidatus Woesebacteria bacterium]